MRTLLVKVFTFVLLGLNFTLSAQVFAPAADRIDSTQYLNEGVLGKDPIFIFYSPGENGWPINGSLTAQLGEVDSLNYKWYLYNSETSAFDILLFEEDSVKTSVLPESSQGGYKIHISNSIKGIDTSLHAWVFMNEFNILGIEVYLSTCEQMELNTRLRFDEEFVYYDLLDQSPVSFYNEQDSLDYTWETVPETTIPKSLSPVFKAPTEETSYRIFITDKFGFERSDYLDILEGEDNGNGNTYLKAVKADFEASRALGFPDSESDTSGQAPLSVQFVNLSENAVDHQWVFYNHPDWRADETDTILHLSTLEQPLDSIVYERPGRQSEGLYDVALTVKGPVYLVNGVEKQCEEHLTKYAYIRVDSTSIPDFPNVFTPNGDNLNDKFEFKDDKLPQSLKSFSIKIYSRWGNRIYSYSDNNGRAWSGWNGETFGNNIAEPGVYYYAVIAEGWNGKVINKSGYIHLFRNQ